MNPATHQAEILTGGTHPGYLYALSASTGKILWKYQPPDLSIMGSARQRLPSLTAWPWYLTRGW